MSSSAESLTTATPPSKKRRVEGSEAEEDDHSSNGTKNGVKDLKVIYHNNSLYVTILLYFKKTSCFPLYLGKIFDISSD